MYGVDSCTPCSHVSTLECGGRTKKIKHGLGANYNHKMDKFCDIVTTCQTLTPLSFTLSDTQGVSKLLVNMNFAHLVYLWYSRIFHIQIAQFARNM